MMSRSDAVDVAAMVRDGECVLGCLSRDVHFASCDSYGKESADAACRGCAPSPTPTGSAICAKCFGRIRGLLRDAPDLVGRLRSLSDPAKAMQIAAVKVFSRPVEAIAPVGPDLLDAADTILSNLRDWAHHVERGLPWHSRFSGMDSVSAYLLASKYSSAIIQHLPRLTADPAQVLNLVEAVTVLHPEVEEERASWSIADALNRWGIERRDRHVFVYSEADESYEESVSPVHESAFDPLLEVPAAAKEAEVSRRTVERWISNGDLEVRARIWEPDGRARRWVRRSKLMETAALMESRKSPGRPRGTRPSAKE